MRPCPTSRQQPAVLPALCLRHRQQPGTQFSDPRCASSRSAGDRNTTRVRRCPRQPCVPITLGCVGRYWSRRDASASQIFEAWITDYCAELGQTHLEPLAHRVAARIRDQLTLPLNVTNIARHVGAHPSAIRRSFRRDFQMSLREYQTRARVQRAIDLLRSTDAKIERVAVEVGWHSKKDLYRAFRHIHECTPATMRRHAS